MDTFESLAHDAMYFSVNKNRADRVSWHTVNQERRNNKLDSYLRHDRAEPVASAHPVPTEA